MEEQILLPQQMIKKYLQGGLVKVNNPLWKTFLYGIMAGAFVGLGASASSVGMYGIDNVSVSRTVGGVIFPIGLILILIMGGELFTGNCLLVMGVADKRFSVKQFLKNIVTVYAGNLVGSAIISILVVKSGQLQYSQNALAAYAIKTAVGKTNLSFETALISGILCNILVCAAVILALAAKDAIGKVFCIFFPIFVFVICGFEHCVANMYYITTGIMAAANPDFALKATELYGYTAQQLADLGIGTMFVNNLLPVTIGNFLGGAVFLALPLYLLNKPKKDNHENKIHRVM